MCVSLASKSAQRARSVVASCDRERTDAVSARAEGHSLNAIERATGVSRATVRRTLVREGDPAPPRVRRTGGGTYPAHPARNGDRPEPC